jgi:hypothetical protein
VDLHNGWVGRPTDSKAFPTETEILAWGSLALFGISLLFSVTGKIIAKETEHELDTN